jgi:putative hydrolase of the HAD superfamily
VFSSIRAVFFDLDQTLILQRHNFEEICLQTARDFAEALAPVSPEDFVRVFFPHAVAQWNLMMDQAKDGGQCRRDSFRDALAALDLDPGLAEPMAARGDHHWIAANELDPQSKPLLDALASLGYIRAILTNGYRDIQQGKIARHGLHAHVDFALASEEARTHKPAPGIFLQACTQARVAPEETLYVGDLLLNDVAGPKAAGLRAILIDRDDTYEKQRAKHPDSPAPDTIINALPEIVELLA